MADNISVKKILVIGTEEFMFPALYIGRKMEKEGAEVRCHSTTRSPIAVIRFYQIIQRNPLSLITFQILLAHSV